jgi:glycosyltransferase involved in cell wall biosynthesis
VTDVAVLIPVLARPHRVEPLLASLLQTRGGHQVVPYFICSPDDDAQISKVREKLLDPFIVEWPPERGDYARKMNYAWQRTQHEWVLFGADDLVFHPDWLDDALAVHEATSACVVGTNDLGNARVVRGRHSTHTLVHRDYGECGTIDDADVILHEGYWHNFVDDEFVQTAMWRQTWAFAAGSHVEHLHPNWGKAEGDATYRRGMEHFEEDRQLYRQRARLWNPARRGR